MQIHSTKQVRGSAHQAVSIAHVFASCLCTEDLQPTNQASLVLQVPEASDITRLMAFKGQILSAHGVHVFVLLECKVKLHFLNQYRVNCQASFTYRVKISFSYICISPHKAYAGQNVVFNNTQELPYSENLAACSV